MSSPAHSSVSTTAIIGANANSALTAEDFHFPSDLISIQDRKDEAMMVLKLDVMAALNKEVKSLDEDGWMFEGPRSRINLISSSSQDVVVFMENTSQKKPTILCLHGYRTSGKILQKMLGRWPEKVIRKMNLVFLDGPFSAEGKSDVEGIYGPPYYEWFHNNQDFSEFTKFEECVEYIEAFMVKNGPFDGFLGFSQGATLAATLPGMQAQGVALQKVERIKILILMSAGKMGGSKFGLPKLATNAFSSPIHCPSLHFIGEKDFLREDSKFLLKSFVNPIAIHHEKGHIVPKLDEEQEEIMLRFVGKLSAKL